MYFAQFDENGFPLGFYSEEIHSDAIPEGAIQITTQQWREFIDNPGLRRWIGGEVVTYEPPPPATTVDMIKVEARRRILAIMTEDQQRNTLAAGQAAVMQFGADPANWPPELQQRQGEAMAAWTEIERLRARSNEIEAMQPLPSNIGDDALWLEPTTE